MSMASSGISETNRRRPRTSVRAPPSSPPSSSSLSLSPRKPPVKFVLPDVLARLVLEHATVGDLETLIVADELATATIGDNSVRRNVLVPEKDVGDDGKESGDNGDSGIRGAGDAGLGDLFGRVRSECAPRCAPWWHGMYMDQVRWVRASPGERVAIDRKRARGTDKTAGSDSGDRGSDGAENSETASEPSPLGGLCARLCAAEVPPALVELVQTASDNGRRLIAAGRGERALSILPGFEEKLRRHYRIADVWPVWGAVGSLLEFDLDRRVDGALLRGFRCALRLSTEGPAQLPTSSSSSSQPPPSSSSSSSSQSDTRLELTVQLETLAYGATDRKKLVLGRKSVDRFLVRDVLPIVRDLIVGDRPWAPTAITLVPRWKTSGVGVGGGGQRLIGVIGGSGDPDFVFTGDANRPETAVAFARIIAALRHGLAATAVRLPPPPLMTTFAGPSTEALAKMGHLSRTDYVARVTRAFPGLPQRVDTAMTPQP